MHYQEYSPSRHLKHYIQCFWTLESESPAGELEPEPIVPDGRMEIIFNLGESFRRHHDLGIETQPSAIVVGQMTRFVLVEAPRRVKLFGIRFAPAGLYPMLQQPMSELTDTIESIDSVLNGTGRLIEEKIHEASNDLERKAVFEHLFTHWLIKGGENTDLASVAARTILNHGGSISVEALANRFNTNVKQLERQFARQIGLTPKRFSRIVRVQKIVQSLTESSVVNWSDTALSFGYFDQSHFINEFREITGSTPQAFVSRQNQLTELFLS